MINSELPPVTQDTPLPAAPGSSVRGAAWVAFIAAMAVCFIWFAFYLVVFLPRAAP